LFFAFARKTKIQKRNRKKTKQARMERHEREARVALVLVSLPLPPVPVLACRGEDAADGVCSSHDLHAVMLATDMQRVVQGALTPEKHETARLKKCAVLNGMHDKMLANLVGINTAADIDDAASERCYAVLCDTLRRYWALYAHACADVRVCDLDSVVTGDLVHTHMLAYVRANLAAEIEDGDSYRTLFNFWLHASFIKLE
jgi:hypothetical protein